VTADLVLRYAASRHRACRAAGQRCRDGAHRQQPDPRQRDDARRGEAGENGAEAATDGSSDSRALGHLAAELRLLTIGEESAPAVFRHQEHHVVLGVPAAHQRLVAAFGALTVPEGSDRSGTNGGEMP